MIDDRDPDLALRQVGFNPEEYLSLLEHLEELGESEVCVYNCPPAELKVRLEEVKNWMSAGQPSKAEWIFRKWRRCLSATDPLGRGL